MAAKKPKHPKINYLANLPDDITITNIVKHENCDEYFVTTKSPPNRICPFCGSNNCVIKDSGRTQTVRHTANNQRGVIITIHKHRLLCKECHASFIERLAWLHPVLHMTNALWITLCLDLTQMGPLKNGKKQARKMLKIKEGENRDKLHAYVPYKAVKSPSRRGFCAKGRSCPRDYAGFSARSRLKLKATE